MSNLLTDGFDWFPTGLSSSDRLRLWGANDFFAVDGVSPQSADVETGRFGFGKAMLFNDSSFGGSMGYIIPTGVAAPSGFIGLAIFIYPDTASNAGVQVEFYDAVTDIGQVVVKFCANGVIKVFNGDGTPLGTSVAGVFQENEWFHCEMKASIAGTGGTVEVRINTKTVIDIPDANTQSSGLAYFDSIVVRGFKSATTNFHFLVDDLFVNDETGSECNTWGGNLRVKSQFMTANGVTNNFTIGGSSPAATNWQSVLNQNLDDVKYVYDITPGDKDLYVPDPNLNSPIVRVVQVRLALRQDDSTQRSAKALLRLGSTNYEGSLEFFTNTTYTFYKQKWQLNPATSVSFTGSEVNGCQVGVKVQS
jgi:hypothetical protein